MNHNITHTSHTGRFLHKNRAPAASRFLFSHARHKPASSLACSLRSVSKQPVLAPLLLLPSSNRQQPSSGCSSPQWILGLGLPVFPTKQPSSQATGRSHRCSSLFSPRTSKHGLQAKQPAVATTSPRIHCGELHHNGDSREELVDDPPPRPPLPRDGCILGPSQCSS